MTAGYASASKPGRVSGAKLDGAKPLLKAVVNSKAVGPGYQILLQGSVPTAAHVLLDGQAYRHRLLEDGRRQITAVLLPGDVCDLEAAMQGRADYSVSALTNCILGELPLNAVADPTTVDPELARALWRCLLRDQAIAREWLVNLGCRTAFERAAHLICEMRFRLQAAGLTEDNAFELRMTQGEMADLLGLSNVHVNRTLKELRETGLVEFSKSTVSILDVSALERLASFDPIYLKMA